MATYVRQNKTAGNLVCKFKKTQHIMHKNNNE